MIKLRMGRLSIEDVACIGYPAWGIRFKNPSKCFGLFCEIDLPNAHYELRWTEKSRWMFMRNHW